MAGATPRSPPGAGRGRRHPDWPCGRRRSHPRHLASLSAVADAAVGRTTPMGWNREQIEAFLYREARLIDEHRYDEWLSLWTDEAIYWVPCNEDDTDPERQVSIIYDDRVRLGERVARLQSGAAWAQEPKSRMRRV